MEIKVVIIVLLLSLIVAIIIRFISLGMNWLDAIRSTLTFPLEISYVHYALYKRLKAEGNKDAHKVLFLPVTNLPRTIISYADMKLDMKAKFEVVKELLSETKESDRERLIEVLGRHGIKVEKVECENQDKKNKDKPSHKKLSIYSRSNGAINLKGIGMGSYEESLRHILP